MPCAPTLKIRNTGRSGTKNQQDAQRQFSCNQRRQSGSTLLISPGFKSKAHSFDWENKPSMPGPRGDNSPGGSNFIGSKRRSSSDVSMPKKKGSYTKENDAVNHAGANHLKFQKTASSEIDKKTVISSLKAVVLAFLSVVGTAIVLKDFGFFLPKSNFNNNSTSQSKSETENWNSTKTIGGWQTADKETEIKYGTDLCNIDKLFFNEVSVKIFESEYRFKKPLLLKFKNGAKDWTNPDKWTVESLKASYGKWFLLSGSSLEIVRHGGNGYVESSFVTFVDQLMKKSDSLAEPSYVFDRDFYKDSELPLTLKPPKYLSVRDDLDDSIFFLGGSGSGVTFHNHADAWNGVVFGRKRWFLYPLTKTPPGGMYPGFSQLDWFNKVYPTLTEENRPMECIQQAGEIMYLPEGMYHGTINLGDTVAVGIQKKQASTEAVRLAYEDLKLVHSPETIPERLELHQKMLELLPGNSRVHMEIGGIFEKANQLDDALYHTQQALKTDPFFVVAIVNLASIYKKMGRKHDAEQMYRKVMEMNPKLWDIYAQYGTFLLDEKRPEEAAELLKKGTEIQPLETGFWRLLRVAYEQIGDLDGAHRIQQKLEELDRP